MSQKRVLWVSRHPVLESQLVALRRKFGDDVLVIQDARPFASANDISTRFRKGGYDDLVVVAPLSVLQRLCEEGITPMWAEMQVVSREQGEVNSWGRPYQFQRFRRLEKVTMQFDEEEVF